MRLLQLIEKFVSSRWQQKLHIIIVISLAGLVRFAILYLPYKSYRWILGNRWMEGDFCSVVTKRQLQIAYRCGHFIERACKKLPWKALCLVQSIVFAIYARYYKLPYVLRTGMAKADTLALSSSSKMEQAANAIVSLDNNDQFSNPTEGWLAHAWVQVGPLTVVGGGDLSDFKRLAMYSYYCD